MPVPGIPPGIPQLDRRFVYDQAFTRLGWAAVNNDTNAATPMMNLSSNETDNTGESFSIWPGQFDPSAIGMAAQSGAWFMPFNLDPTGDAVHANFHPGG